MSDRPPLVIQLAERPDLFPRFHELASVWAPFMGGDPVVQTFREHMEVFSKYLLVAFDPDEPDRLVARATSIPFRLARGGDAPEALPDAGWDQVVRWAAADLRAGVEPDTVSALEIAVAPDYLGRGMSPHMVRALRENTRRLGFDTLVAPVRPNGKHLHPRVPMSEYAYWTRDDGLPHDPWMRVHARLGATVEGVCPLSMTVPGTLDQWRTWTGLPFDRSGPVEVPGALVPVDVTIEHDHAVYVEPNVWMRHKL
ncbi:N-acetyltransferase [Marinitenerispora sediminis]|uniref:N-acetyltransferase n=1 Tax=Marinitenerispora sediminis TaxID=1931232 RepID=A0A368T073_9ACTN|nr:N-acetyltransferase [Marinitenerispora sediminis]RCV50999.1 N-acetyltransferase [Marinitenerispora sediminis]RCV52236.1 N-acetyltransferase [Marinitenerispora sediminis]RCV53844.1 N-acetyltransferase [Marinitenerispora sediminis]